MPNEMDEVAKYKLFLSANENSNYYNNDYYSNPVTRNLYRSWPFAYTTRTRDTIPEDIVDELVDEQLVTLRQYEYGNKLDFMDGLRRANWYGLKDNDEVEVVPKNDDICHCLHGDEMCCAFAREKAKMLS